MIPDTSAGSNHTGASETCTPQVSCPSGPAASAEPGAPAARPSAASARRSRRVIAGAVAPPRRKTGCIPPPIGLVVTGPTSTLDQPSEACLGVLLTQEAARNP